MKKILIIGGGLGLAYWLYMRSISNVNGNTNTNTNTGNQYGGSQNGEPYQKPNMDNSDFQAAKPDTNNDEPDNSGLDFDNSAFTQPTAGGRDGIWEAI